MSVIVVRKRNPWKRRKKRKERRNRNEWDYYKEGGGGRKTERKEKFPIHYIIRQRNQMSFHLVVPKKHILS